MQRHLAALRPKLDFNFKFDSIDRVSSKVPLNERISNYRQLIYISNMKTIILVLAIAVAAFAVTLGEPKPTQLSTSKRALQFNNFTGAGVSSAHLTSFTNYANSASSFYKDDVQANAKYIKESMDADYGVATLNFFVVIQTENVRFSWLVWITNENCIASLSGINRVNPDWSYLFLKFIAPATSEDYSFIAPDTRGQGITPATDDFISSVVNNFETGDICTCNDYETMDIGYGLINGQGVAWSTICGATENLYGLVYTVNGLWIHAHPKNCYYTFYVSQ